MYERPIIKRYGHLSELTADDGGLTHAGLSATAFSLPITHTTPPGSGTTAGPTGGGGEFTLVDDGAVLGGGPDVGAGGPGGGGAGGPGGGGAPGGGGGGGGGGELPFTGFAAATVALLGSIFVAGGARARRMLRR